MTEFGLIEIKETLQGINVAQAKDLTFREVC
jgi:hypothetical protein